MMTKEQTMKTIRLIDNQLKIPDEALKNIPEIVNKLVNKTLGELEKEGVFVFPGGTKDIDDLDGAQMILQKINGTYRTSNVMGFLGYGNERLIVSSRFSNGGSERNDFFLQYLLSRVINIPNLFELYTNVNRENQILDVLAFLFPKYLKHAVRKGAFKSYVRNEYNDCRIKGNLNAARHIKQNTPFVGNIAYSQREYSYDNDITELIRHTIEYIRRKTYGRHILGSIKDEVEIIEEVTPSFRPHNLRKVLLANKINILRHAYYSEYRELQRLCIMILQSEKQELGFGPHQVYGVLFDGAWLWEEYINTLVKACFYHPQNKAHFGAEQLFSGERKVGLIYPDFIGNNRDNRIIADAKYKPFNNIGGHDYLQLLAYMLRFDSKTGIYFYPESSCNTDTYLWLNKGVSQENNVISRTDMSVIKHGLHIPNDAKNYVEFSKGMEKAEIDFISMLN